MTTRPPRHMAWLMFGAVVVMVGCGPSGNDAATTATDAPATPAPATTLAVRDDLVDPQVVTWRSWRVLNDTTLEFTVTAGSADCYAAHADVVESDTTVRVRLQVGRIPEAADRECPAIAHQSIVPVPLAAPLGSRPVEPLT